MVSVALLAIMMAGMSLQADVIARRGMDKMSRGQWSEGWADYESRVSAWPELYSTCKLPLSSQISPTVVVYAEQGVGDQIQFSRYLKPLAKQSRRVCFVCSSRLRPLFSQITEVKMATRGDIERCESRVLLMSLPRLMGLPSPSESPRPPYLQADETHASELRPLLEKIPSRLKVGIAWRGGAKNPNDAARSIPELHFITLAQNLGIAFIGLQTGNGDGAKADEVRSVIDGLDESSAFYDTAAIIQNLDLVISCDTSVAHLAGAMGKPVWLLLAHRHDWRWPREGETTPWYPSMRLFRQQTPGDWGEVFERIASELKRLI